VILFAVVCGSRLIAKAQVSRGLGHRLISKRVMITIERRIAVNIGKLPELVGRSIQLSLSGALAEG
jgi:hypothetical protein